MGCSVDRPLTDKEEKSAGYPSLLGDGGDPLHSEGPVDEIPPVSSGVPITLGGSRTGLVNTPGDADGYAINLVAGQSYVFTLTGTGATPLEDPLLELYFNGRKVAMDDDAGPGRNAMMRFTAPESGIYYVSARAWEPDEGPTLTGEYTLTAALGPPQNPLDALDLGFTVPTTNISVYFAAGGQTHDGTTAQRSWTPSEITAAMSAMMTISAVTTLNFTQAASAAGATFILMLADLPGNVLGEFGTVNGTGYGVFDPDPSIWSAALLQPGGLAFGTIIHEIGHGLGLAHPHDNSGIDPNDSSEILQGVVSDFDSYGTYGFNQGAFTVMSYNRGAPSLPYGSSFSAIYGGESTPGPLDIALLQQKYGINVSTNAGDNVYVLAEGNGPGTRYQALWDVGGSDSITYTGASEAVIDLRAATLLTAPGGAGGLSYVSGTYGGFTIPNGVVIEVATSGSGNDKLFGGAGNNTLTSGAGNDTLSGGAGFDTLNGGGGDDRVLFEDNPAGVTVNLLLQTATDGWGTTDTLSSIEFVTGSAFNDTIISGLGTATGEASASGGAGNDYIEGHASGWASLNGGDGDDTLVMLGGGQAGINGEEGNDTIVGGNLDDVTLDGGGGDDNIRGGGGADLIYGGQGHDTLYGESGNDDINGYEGVDSLIGGDGNDILQGGDGDDMLSAGADNDTLYGGIGNDFLDGGSGIDTLSYERDTFGAVTVSLAISGAQNVVRGDFDTLVGIENLIGTDGADSLTGNESANILKGEYGADTLRGGGGDDTLFGGWGNDYILGGAGNDLMSGNVAIQFIVPELLERNDTFDGGDGVDTVSYQSSDLAVVINLALTTQDTQGAGLDTFFNIENLIGSQFNDALAGDANANTLDGGIGADRLDGGRGVDFARYASADVGVTADLVVAASNTGEALGDSYASIEGLIGSAFADTLSGDGAGNALYGNGGNDRLEGRGGNDEIYGGDGDDQLNGGAGADYLNGGAGFDTARYDGASAGVTIYVDAAYANTGEAAGDFHLSIEGIVGSSFADYLAGGVANNVLQGFSGNDIIEGREGEDLLDGGDGDDQLNGGLGGDIIDGGAGFDTARYDGAVAGVTIYVDAAYANQGEAAGDFHFSIEGIVGSTFGDYLVGGVANNVLEGFGGVDILEGHAGDDYLGGGDGDDQLNGGTGGDVFDGGAGFDTARYDGASAGVVVFMGDTWANAGEGAGDNFISIEALVGSNFNDTLAGDGAAYNELYGLDGEDNLYGYGGADFVNGGNGADVLDGGSGDDTLNGGLGNDTVIGGLGTDLVVQGAGDGRDIIDGGAGADTYRLLGTAAAETFRIMTRAEAVLAGITGLAGATEIVITRNGTDNALVIAELDNIEEIEIDSLIATANNGNGVVDGGASGGDTIIVVGDFTTTSLDYSTITINGSTGNDTIDISGLTSEHRVVFASNGGADSVIGQPRAQDVFGQGMFGASDGIDAMVGMRGELRELARTGPRDEGVGRTMIEMAGDLLPLDLVDADPVAAPDIAMPIHIDTMLDHRPVLTDYPLA